jgi:peptide/nickel transport system permease protein
MPTSTPASATETGGREPSGAPPAGSALGRGLGLARRVLGTSPTAVLGAGLLGLHVGLAVLGPTLAPYHFAQFHILHTLAAPSGAFLAGTDQYGRDQLSRVMWGARSTLTLATASTLLGVGLGVLVGMLGAFYRGVVDEILMRIVDALMALPALLLAMLLLTTVGANPVYVALGIAVVFMPRSARVVRGVALSLAAAEFIDAARARGERGLYIIGCEMLPNAWAPIIVELSIRFAYAILLATSLGFLGLGAQPPAPDWGLMINEALPFLAQAPWLAILPAAAISSAVVGANLLGDALREALALGRMGEAP